MRSPFPLAVGYLGTRFLFRNSIYVSVSLKLAKRRELKVSSSFVFPRYSPPASMSSRLASVTFKMARQVFIEETDKNFDFITEMLFRFLGFGDFKVSNVIEN